MPANKDGACTVIIDGLPGGLVIADIPRLEACMLVNRWGEGGHFVNDDFLALIKRNSSWFEPVYKMYSRGSKAITEALAKIALNWADNLIN